MPTIATYRCQSCGFASTRANEMHTCPRCHSTRIKREAETWSRYRVTRTNDPQKYKRR